MDQAGYDDAFLQLTGTPELTAAAAAVSNREHLRRDVVRVASSLFCADGLDPSVVSFAAVRLAAHWGRNEEEIDLMIAHRLLLTATGLMAASEAAGEHTTLHG
ncbi:hypothetical protein ACVBEQ_10685 [Nakamurella sp. GG22]